MSVLSDELTNDPLTRGYAAMSDVEAAADLNLVNRPDTVPAVEAMQVIVSNSLWATLRERAEIQTVAGTYDNPKMRAFVDAVLAIGGTNAPFDMSDGEFWATITQACVTEGTLGAGARTAFLALADDRRSRAAELGITPVRVGQVEVARA